MSTSSRFTDDAFLIIKPEALATNVHDIDVALAGSGLSTVARHALDRWPELARRLYQAEVETQPDLEAWLAAISALFPRHAQHAEYRAMQSTDGTATRTQVAGQLLAFKERLRTSNPLARDYTLHHTRTTSVLYFSLIHTPDPNDASIEREIAILRGMYDTN